MILQVGNFRRIPFGKIGEPLGNLKGITTQPPHLKNPYWWEMKCLGRWNVLFEMVPFFWCFLVKFSWWLNQPIWKYNTHCIISPVMKIKNLWSHHPEPCLCEYSHGSGIREVYMQVAGGSHVLGILGSCDPSISLKQLINRNGHQLFAFRVKEGVLDLEIDRSVTLRIPFSTSMMCFCSVFSPCRPPHQSVLRPLRVLRRSLRISCSFDFEWPRTLAPQISICRPRRSSPTSGSRPFRWAVITGSFDPWSGSQVMQAAVTQLDTPNVGRLPIQQPFQSGSWIT